jgi:hypothetical protein
MPIPPEVALKEVLPILHHKTDEFASIYKDVAQGLKYIFQIKNEVYTFASSRYAKLKRKRFKTLRFQLLKLDFFCKLTYKFHDYEYEHHDLNLKTNLSCPIFPHKW